MPVLAGRLVIYFFGADKMRLITGFVLLVKNINGSKVSKIANDFRRIESILYFAMSKELIRKGNLPVSGR